MQREKKFVLGVAALGYTFFIGVWILAWVLSPMRYMNGEYPYWKQQLDYLNDTKKDSAIILMGDSRLQTGIIPHELSDEAVYNLAMGGATPIEMYYSLKKYLANHGKPKAAIIAFTPMHYYMLDTTYFDKSQYYHYFDGETTAEINAAIKRIDGKDVRFKVLPYTLRLPSIYMKPIIESLTKPQTKQNTEYYDAAKKANGYMVFSNPKEMNEVISMEARNLPDPFVSLNSLDYYMGLLIELCQKEGIPVIIEQLPLGSPGWQMLVDAGYMGDYVSYLEGLQKKYAIPVETAIPLFDNKYFMDNDAHLNPEGAKVLTALWRKKHADFLTQTSEGAKKP